MKFFTTPNSNNVIATLRIVTIERSELAFILILYVMRWAIWQHLYHLKNVKNTHGGVFFTLFKWYKCYQIAQRTTFVNLVITSNEAKERINRSSPAEVFCKKVFLKILQNSKENNCARTSFLIKLQAEAWNFIKKETLAQMFSCEFCEISKKTFSYRTPPVAASRIKVKFLLQLISSSYFHSVLNLKSVQLIITVLMHFFQS